jgi:DNA repair protein RecN (Recombination protein N)
LNYLDTFAGLEALRAEVEAAFDEVQKLRMRRAELLNRQNEIRARRDLEAFQLQEIKAVDPQPGEEEALMEELKLLGNAERRSELAGRIIDLLAENQHAIQSQLRTALEALEELNRLDPRFRSLHEECRSAEAVLLETAHELGRYQNQIELDASRLEHVRERLAELQRLKKKYGGAMAEVFGRLEKLEASQSAFENFDSELAELNRQVAEAEAACARLALELSDRRKAAARQLGKTVPEVLAELGLPGTRFEARMSVQPEEDGFIMFEGARVRAGRNGIDQIEFYISTNVGHEVSPLAKVASGGEISRIMLALKSIIAERDEIPVLIFDEIDSGVSGRVAQVVGRRLQKLSESHQIICITHLPQIASAGRHHFLVEKKTARGRARTVVRRLNPSERTAAIASLLGGEKLTEAHIKSAQELLAEAGNESA